MSVSEDMAPEGDDMLAAEYVIGTLALPERIEAERRIRAEEAFAARVTAWEDHFAPLNDAYAPMPVANLLPAIETRIFGVAPARPSRWRFWSGLTGGALAAAVLAAILLTTLPPPRAPAPQFAATLKAEGQPLVFTASYDPATEILSVTRTAGPAPEAGHDYQLWSIGQSGVPVPLGLASATSVTQKLPGLAPGMALAVSLEPTGGSPNGKPTTVLVSGVVSGT